MKRKELYKKLIKQLNYYDCKFVKKGNLIYTVMFRKYFNIILEELNYKIDFQREQIYHESSFVSDLYIDWSWWWVLSPLWISAIIAIIFN